MSPDIVLAGASAEDDEIENVLDLPVIPRPTISLTLEIPEDTLALIEEIGREHGVSAEVIIFHYISTGLRTDLDQRRLSRLLVRAESIVAQHVQAPDEAQAILNELREAAKVSLPGRRHRTAAQESGAQ